MYISDLQTKDIVNTDDGQNLGRIIDIEINSEGQIINLIVEKKKIWRSLSSSDTSISFKKVSRIGEDVILVNLKN